MNLSKSYRTRLKELAGIQDSDISASFFLKRIPYLKNFEVSDGIIEPNKMFFEFTYFKEFEQNKIEVKFQFIHTKKYDGYRMGNVNVYIIRVSPYVELENKKDFHDRKFDLEMSTERVSNKFPSKWLDYAIGQVNKNLYLFDEYMEKEYGVLIF